MEEKRYIEFQKVRDFGTIIGDTFDFLIKNIKPFLKNVLIIMLPNFLILFLWMRMFGLDFFKFNPEKMTSFPPAFLWVFLVNAVLGLVYMVLAICVNYDYIKLYIEKKGGPITLAELWKEIKKDFLRVLLNLIGFGIIMTIFTAIVVGIIVALGIFVSKVLTAILTFLAIMILLPYLLIALWPSFFIIVFEKKNIVSAIARSFSLIFGKWWLTFGLFIVTMLIWSLLGVIVSIPYYILVFVFAFHGFNITGTYLYALFGIAFLFLSFCSTFMYMIPQTLIALHYFNLKERKEATSLFAKVANMEKLK